MDQNYWRKCIVCKKEINFSTKYYKCSVGGCDKKRAPAQFCSVDCWGVHSSTLNHKSAWSEEYHSPSKAEWESAPKVRIITPKTTTSETSSSLSNSDIPNDVLVVVSKLKAYIKASSDMNTSSDVNDALSDIIRRECDRAVESAKADGRRTVMARDF
ncbi:hypothetical protein A9Q84_01440 [Halobacteriovorax marinus]|uniref:Uncharacterized protein n=1 Tax=Halobacteriovorax marinus TaxID=97084 RepID=A0A1Y5FHQ1_9BACT|nr:hypothetical protein A9Q84_01440 [Halobacteriovorax marinus]